MPREINPNLSPPSGYEFTDKDRTVHRAGGWRALKKKVEAYRRRAGYEVGDVWAEMMAQICGRFPDYCGDYTHSRTPKAHPSGMSFNARVLQWLGGALSKRRKREWPGLVDDAETSRRAAICLTCPFQKALNKTCSSCVAAVEQGRKVLLKGGVRFPELHPCGILAEDTVITVATDLLRVNNGELPTHCWRKGL